MRVRNAFITLVIVASAMPGSGCAQTSSPPQATKAQFAKLSWLTGTWRGSGGNYPSFFEEYRVINDSTFGMRSFSDSTLKTATEGSQIGWRKGYVVSLSPRSAYVAMTLTDSSVHFVREGQTTGGYTWTKRSADHWTATLHPAAPGERPTIYEMRRIKP